MIIKSLSATNIVVLVPAEPSIMSGTSVLAVSFVPVVGFANVPLS